jgi:hypothetical protein
VLVLLSGLNTKDRIFSKAVNPELIPNVYIGLRRKLVHRDSKDLFTVSPKEIIDLLVSHLRKTFIPVYSRDSISLGSSDDFLGCSPLYAMLVRIQRQVKVLSRRNRPQQNYDTPLVQVSSHQNVHGRDCYRTARLVLLQVCGHAGGTRSFHRMLSVLAQSHFLVYAFQCVTNHH